MCSNIFRDIRVYFEIFRQGFWIEIVNISYELIFSDVYRSVNYNGSLAKYT